MKDGNLFSSSFQYIICNVVFFSKIQIYRFIKKDNLIGKSRKNWHKLKSFHYK